MVVNNMNFKEYLKEQSYINATQNQTLEEQQPFAVFVVAPYQDGYAATTRAKDRGESGRIGLPGGKIDPGENPVEAAVRESEEEGWQVLNINPIPIHKAIVEGKMVWWFRADSAQPLTEYKEKYRGIIPIKVDLQTIANSGYGNEFLGKYK